jgi:hypothetical protein
MKKFHSFTWILILTLLFLGVSMAHKAGLWSWSDLLVPEWLQPGPDIAEYQDLKNLAIMAITADAELVGGTIMVADTLTTYIQRDLGADYSASFAFKGAVDLCISTKGVEVTLSKDSVLAFYFSKSQLCKARIVETKMINHDALRHLFIPEEDIEAYRQDHSDRALLRLQTMLPQGDLNYLALLEGLLQPTWARLGISAKEVVITITPPREET